MRNRRLRHCHSGNRQEAGTFRYAFVFPALPDVCALPFLSFSLLSENFSFVWLPFYDFSLSFLSLGNMLSSSLDSSLACFFMPEKGLLLFLCS